MKLLIKLLKLLPKRYVTRLRKIYYKIKINIGSFKSQEKEFTFIDHLVKEGDRVIDIGANVGHYTLKLSRLVGKKGRVIAFEPIPETFDMLSSNIGYAAIGNVTLVNGAISTSVKEVSFTIPDENLYQAHMDEDGDLGVMTFPLKNFLPDDWNLTFIKIDAEGCDESIIQSAIEVINIFRPIVMAEINQSVANSLANKLNDYIVLGVKGSHNKFLVPKDKAGCLSFL